MKKKLSIVLAVVLTLSLLLTGVTFAYAGHKTTVWQNWYTYVVSNWLDMYYSCVTGVRHNLDNKCWCGPSSGISIGWYYREDPDKDYDNLPATCDGYDDCYVPMYDDLWDYMDTGIFGYTDPYDYGPGFVEMALHYEYDNFSYVHDDYVTSSDYENIVDAIDHGWPVALAATGALSGFSGVEELWTDGDPDKWPCTKRHWIAIKGYEYKYNYWSGYLYRYIRCTDSYSGANNLWLSWDDIVYYVGADYLEAVIIKDVDTENDGLVENFEWGTDGASLEAWQSYGGEVDWTVSTSGSSVAEIETDPDYVYSGTRSARFYRGGISSCYAYYDLWQPSYIEFYLKKGDTANAGFRNGDGDKRIYVDITDAEELRYFDTAYQSVCSVSADEWHFIEFKNINWGAGTYDIYVDGSCPPEGEGAEMRGGSGSAGKAWFEIFASTGSFWIDDIKDSLVQPD